MGRAWLRGAARTPRRRLLCAKRVHHGSTHRQADSLAAQVRLHCSWRGRDQRCARRPLAIAGPELQGAPLGQLAGPGEAGRQCEQHSEVQRGAVLISAFRVSGPPAGRGAGRYNGSRRRVCSSLPLVWPLQLQTGGWCDAGCNWLVGVRRWLPEPALWGADGLPASSHTLQKGAWSPAFHPFCPLAFKEATEELLRISHKHGARLGLTHNLLVDLLLPVLAADMSSWL